MDTYHKLPIKIREEIIKKHFEKGISQAQLAKDYNVSRQIIWRYCHKKGISPFFKGYKIDNETIIDLYNQKKSILQIYKITGLGRRQIDKRLKLAGIEKRQLSRRKEFEQISNYRIKMRIWKLKVKEADNMKCMMCGNTKHLHVNHIIPVRDISNSNDLFDINNGITLCKKCHLKIHFKEYEFVDRFKQLISKRCFVDK